MRFWLDCEWNDYKGELISMALVADDGTEWYAVLGCKNPTPWVQMNVMPSIKDTPKVSRELMRGSLCHYLSDYESVFITVDWPEDIKHFCDLLIIGPGKRIGTPPLSFEIRRDLNSDKSELLHNALADARALRKMEFSL